jgi:hypothetical protein
MITVTVIVASCRDGGYTVAVVRGASTLISQTRTLFRACRPDPERHGSIVVPCCCIPQRCRVSNSAVYPWTERIA